MTLTSNVGRPAYRFYTWLWKSLDLLFPPRCAGCDVRGERWCGDCQSGTKLVALPVCQQCGRGMYSPGKCKRCQTQPPIFTSLRSWGIYEDSLRNAILKLKYAGDMTMGDVLARPLIKMLGLLPWKVDLVVPVPMGADREAERGYNQAALLAVPVALSTGLPYQLKALKKVRDIPTQVGLSIDERYENVEGAFVADQVIVDRKSVLVIDDVVTSGATMDACSKALCTAGARDVYGLTLARAKFK